MELHPKISVFPEADVRALHLLQSLGIAPGTCLADDRAPLG